MIVKARFALLSVLMFGIVHTAAFAAVPFVYVAPVMQVVSGARLQSISDAWAHRLVKDNLHQAVLAYPVTDQRVISGHTQLRPSTAAIVSANYASLPIEIRVDGVLVRTIYTGYRIVTLVKTPVLNQAKHRGDILSLNDFHVEMIADDGRAPVDVRELVGRVLNADQTAGSVVHPEETSVNQIVKAGSPVVLIVHDGTVALAADVTARTSGGIGEMVTVYDENARKMLSGIVTAPSRIELTLPEVSDQ